MVSASDRTARRRTSSNELDITQAYEKDRTQDKKSEREREWTTKELRPEDDRDGEEEEDGKIRRKRNKEKRKRWCLPAQQLSEHVTNVKSCVILSG